MNGLEALLGSREVFTTTVLVLLVLARVVPLVVFVPFFAGVTSSTSVRAVVSIAILAAVYPSATAGVGVLGDSVELFLLLLAKEVVIGLSLGVLAAVGFHVLTMAGQLIDQVRGAEATTLDPLAGDVQSPLASFHLLLGVVLFLLVGGHRAFLTAVAGSYQLVPLAELPLAGTGVREGALALAQLFGAAFAGALMLAAPAVVALLAADLIIGLLGRTAPGFASTLTGMPLRAALGLAMALFALTIVFQTFLPELVHLSRLVERVAGQLGAAP